MTSSIAWTGAIEGVLGGRRPLWEKLADFDVIRHVMMKPTTCISDEELLAFANRVM